MQGRLLSAHQFALVVRPHSSIITLSIIYRSMSDKLIIMIAILCVCRCVFRCVCVCRCACVGVSVCVHKYIVLYCIVLYCIVFKYLYSAHQQP